MPTERLLALGGVREASKGSSTCGHLQKEVDRIPCLFRSSMEIGVLGREGGWGGGGGWLKTDGRGGGVLFLTVLVRIKTKERRTLETSI